MPTPAVPRPGQPVAMVALTTLFQAAWSGRLPNVTSGQPFWAKYEDSTGLVAAGYARAWQSGDPPMPPPEPPNTAHGIAGVGAGARNSSPGVSLPHYAGPPPASRQN